MNKVLITELAFILGSLNTLAAGLTGLDVNEKKFRKLHQAGFTLQIQGVVDIAYYTDNHEYTIGFGGLTYTDAGDDTNSINPVIFFRKNMHLQQIQPLVLEEI
jgi:hypothetical protein